jgi:hypothetical protein
MVLGAPRAAFRLTKGELTTYVDTADSGNTVERKFCRPLRLTDPLGRSRSRLTWSS